MRAPQAHVLIVDDDEDMRRSLADALTDAGFAVSSAGNGREALDHLGHAPAPDVILLDLLMPVMNGWQFCQLARSTPMTAGIPIIAMSAAVSRDPASPYFIDVQDHIAKPVDLDELLSKLAPFTARDGSQAAMP